MTYVVTVDICIAEGTPEMDPLQRAGAVALLENGLASIDGIDGPDGREVDLLDAIVAVYPGGALLKVFVDAEALEFAEDAVRDVVGEVLQPLRAAHGLEGRAVRSRTAPGARPGEPRRR
ncbi:hypothetical protein ACH4U6_05180 [Streptomyces netropsis]|uniref:hypothetical protein n=1 Tax=Streptomyces netropsis TaxID=55404 RepID=UPI003793CB2C